MKRILQMSAGAFLGAVIAACGGGGGGGGQAAVRRRILRAFQRRGWLERGDRLEMEGAPGQVYPSSTGSRPLAARTPASEA